MKLREFVNLYAGDEVLMNLLSEDGMEFDTVPIDPSLASTNRINKKWLDGEVEYFDFHDDELYVSVKTSGVTASTRSRKKSVRASANKYYTDWEDPDTSEFIDVTYKGDNESLRELKGYALSLGDSTEDGIADGYLTIHTDVYHAEDLAEAADQLGGLTVAVGASTKKSFTAKPIKANRRRI